MKLLLLSLCLPCTLAVISLHRQSYNRLPYQFVNGDPSNPRYAMFQDAAYKAAYHTVDRILYVASGNANFKYLHLWDMNNPSNPQLLMTHTFDNPLDAKITAVAACSDTIAVALSQIVATNEGHVEMFTPYNRADQVFTSLGRIVVGSSPKDLAFTSDCRRIVVASEGPPGLDAPPDSSAAKFIDPEGIVTIIVRNDQGFPSEINMDFTQFNDRAAELIGRGVRYVFRGNHSQGIVNTFSQDLEPESVTISSDDRYAFVSLQENNAIAKIDLAQLRIVDIYPLGAKNWTSFDLDASDSNKAYNGRRHHVYSFYQPASLAYGVVNGQGYVISADTGSTKTLTQILNGYDFTDARRCRAARSGGLIDTAAISAQLDSDLASDQALGRAYMSTLDGIGIFGNLIEDVYLFGGRGISLWHASTMAHVFESGEDLEKRAAETYPQTFNGECSSTNQSPIQQADLRSDDMGPEPNSLAVGTVGGVPTLVVGTRTGLLYTFSMRGVGATFESVHREGQTNDIWGTLYNNDNAGDAIISDIGFIDAHESATGHPVVYVVSRGSGSLSVYEVRSA